MSMFKVGELIEDKDGKKYLVIESPSHNRLIQSGVEPYYRYIVPGGSIEWLRPQSEVEEGRFVLVEDL